MSFDCPHQTLLPMKEQLAQDRSVIRPRILREEEELGRPCDEHVCAFGELTDDLRKILEHWDQKYIKKL